jgi:hypothetical protein
LSLIQIMSKNQTKLKIAEAISDLNSGSSTKALAALKILETIGDKSILPSLVQAMKNNDETVVKAIIELISNVQDQDSTEDLVEIIRNEKDAVVRQKLLTSIWNSKLDFSTFLAEFVSLATEGDFLQALECLTIIENLSGPFEEHQLLESQLYLKDYLEDSEDKEERKNQIISEIALFIKDQNDGIDADLLLD